jgi:tetratricopeptide (TPR) repeat protein
MHRLRGSVLFLRQQWEAAKADYERALQSKPDDAAAQFDLGICYLQLGENQDALRALREAARYDPTMIVARFEFARLLWEEGMKDSARTELAEAQTIAPDHPQVKDLTSLFGNE